MKKELIFSVSMLLPLMFVTEARAEDSYPKFSGEIAFEIQNDWAHNSDDPDAEVNTLHTKIEPYLMLQFTDRLSIEAAMVFEPVQDTDPGDDTIFENEGLFFEELKFVYSGENYTLFAGKFNAAFGTAWDLAPGIYGPDFAEDYEVTERIGFGASYNINSEELGSHTITGSTFFLDTSGLSESVVTRRGNTNKSDGGVSNTEDFSSFSLALDSENLAGFAGLNTHLGFYNQANGDADTGLDHEKGFAVGANYTFALSEVTEASLLGEWVGIYNSGGGMDDIRYITTSAGLTFYEKWNVAGSYTKRDTDVSGGSDVNDYIYQISAGYAFDNGISFDVGYSGLKESGTNTDLIGALLAYTYEF